MVERRKVNVGGIPHQISIVDGCVIFTDESGFVDEEYDIYPRQCIFEYKYHMWVINDISRIRDIPACYLARMYDLLTEMIAPDHTEGHGNVFKLEFKK